MKKYLFLALLCTMTQVIAKITSEDTRIYINQLIELKKICLKMGTLKNARDTEMCERVSEELATYSKILSEFVDKVASGFAPEDQALFPTNNHNFKMAYKK